MTYNSFILVQDCRINTRPLIFALLFKIVDLTLTKHIKYSIKCNKFNVAANSIFNILTYEILSIVIMWFANSQLSFNNKQYTMTSITNRLFSFNNKTLTFKFHDNVLNHRLEELFGENITLSKIVSKMVNVMLICN